MAPDPRGSPSDEEYIAYLEWNVEEKQRRIQELEKLRHQTPVWKQKIFQRLVRLMRWLDEDTNVI